MTLKEEMLQSAREGMAISRRVGAVFGLLTGVTIYFAPSPWWALLPFSCVVIATASFVKNEQSLKFWQQQPDKRDNWDDETEAE
jgi:hypothetical protein